MKIPEATKQGYAIAKEGDSINLSNPNSKTRRGRVGGGMANTIDTQMQQYTVVSSTQKHATTMTDKSPTLPGAMGEGGGHIPMLLGKRIRRLTPVECERLQGFPDGWTSLDGKMSDAQRYRQLGNAVSVPVVKAIGERLLCQKP